MCGIMGFYCFGDKKPDKQKITKMFTLLESRGRDASGYAFIKDGNLIVCKLAQRSSMTATTYDWKSMELPSTMIAHTRMKTQGSEKNNANNHPLFNKDGLCIVHNGMIHNDREIFGKDKRDAEVDSEAILYLLSSKKKGNKIKDVFEKIEGSFAIASISAKEPDKLVLLKHDNPIEMYYDEKDEILYFCSEREIMRESLNLKNLTKRGFNLGEGGFHFYTLENNHALIINRDGVESYKKYTPRREDWRMSNLYKRDELLVDCPYCFESTIYHDGRLNNRCEHCHQPLNAEDLYV